MCMQGGVENHHEPQASGAFDILVAQRVQRCLIAIAFAPLGGIDMKGDIL